MLGGPLFRTPEGAHPGKTLSAATLSPNHGVPISRLLWQPSRPLHGLRSLEALPGLMVRAVGWAARASRRLYFARPPMGETGVGNEPTDSL